MTKKKSSSALSNSDLGRHPSKHKFFSILTRVKRHHSDVGMVEDDRKSSSVVRIISGLILIHFVLIGGVLMRGHLTKGHHVAAGPGITAPPAAAPTNTASAPTTTAPAIRREAQPTTGTANTAVTPRTAAPHITQTGFPEEEVAEAVEDTPTPTAAATPATGTQTEAAAAPATPAGTVLVKYQVKSGESWISIARAHNTTQQALRVANKNVRMLMAGAYIQVPVAADSEAGRAAAERQATLAANAPKTHTIKRGETLAKIAKQYKTTTQRIMKWNNMTPADATRLRIGQKIKVSE
ncbi:MAG: LysM peptidoglycan-binding domain-containing protein [Akkermansia sp.]